MAIITSPRLLDGFEGAHSSAAVQSPEFDVYESSLDQRLGVPTVTVSRTGESEAEHTENFRIDYEGIGPSLLDVRIRHGLFRDTAEVEEVTNPYSAESEEDKVNPLIIEHAEVISLAASKLVGDRKRFGRLTKVVLPKALQGAGVKVAKAA